MEKGSNNSNNNSSSMYPPPPPPYFDFDETFTHAPFDYNHPQLFPLPLPSNNKRKHDQVTTSTNLKNYRKAPQAPKHFKSPYVCFATAHQAQVKAQLGSSAKVSQVSAKLGEMWRQLTPQERTVWDAAAERDKARYLTEKAAYTGPWKVPSKKKKKHPDAPKRPMSAFLFYSQKLRGELKLKHPNKRNTEISRMLGEMWRNAPADVRAKHVQREAEERSKYKVELAEFNAKLKLQEEEEQDDEDEEEEQEGHHPADEFPSSSANGNFLNSGYHPYPPHHHGPPPPRHHYHPHHAHHHDPMTPAPFPYHHPGYGGGAAKSMFAQRHYHPSSRWFSPMEEPLSHQHQHAHTTAGNHSATTSPSPMKIPIRPVFTTRTSPIQREATAVSLNKSAAASSSWEEDSNVMAAPVVTSGPQQDAAEEEGDDEWVEGSD
mmetsp:Transcript_12198/g.18386  ORF Transcript_12198/g.18386 Transcript_12198/m.18386 type:complete len:431 (+) Transcript_12198:391-1683(+)|eukprot:CAMPEP_0116024146 /NCGR_PEP_ID=MMETSP0321-20121206/12119_1 /TAXON_ID=163516 /ORGANISM="Leptocylindrus danicus var. danicus, Strain B650" /LENGTH=430 /DNA_ID=CAMNT_0003495773 /DNA_START=474 /DNA_END=1766 /DNA_ORIENTATION=+